MSFRSSPAPSPSPSRARAAWCAALACVLAYAVSGGPARADDGEKARSGFDFGGSKTPAKTPGPAPGEPPPKAAPTVDDPVQQDVLALAGWPDRKAKRAAEALFLRQAEAIPHLLRALEDGPPEVQPGAAWVLGQVGEEVHVQVILRAAAQRPNASRADVFFDAAYALGPQATKRWLVSFLTVSDRPVFRDRAGDFLAGVVGAEDRARVLDLSSSDKAAVRIHGLRLLAAAGVEDADERLLQSLSEIRPEVALEAARLLARRADDAMVARLNARAREAGSRERGYAVLALVELARASASNPFEEATVLELAGRRGLLHPEPFARTAAAVGLTYGALEATDEAIASLLDGRVVDTLIQSVGGGYFRDYGSVAFQAFAALRRLTGRDLPETAVAWAAWWRDHRANFRARRPLQSLDPADVGQAWVEYEAVEGNGRRTRAVFVPADGILRPGAMLLRRPAFEGLAAFLEGEGLFEAENRGGLRADEHVAVTLGVLNQRRRMTVAAAPPAAGEVARDEHQRRYDRIRMRLSALIATNEWQTWRDADRWPDPIGWWQANAEAMEQAAPDQRDVLLAASIVHAYDDLPDDGTRAQALDRLRSLRVPLGAAPARTLALELAAAPAFGRLEAEGLHWIVAQGHPALHDELAEALAARTEAGAREMLAGLLLEGGVDRMRQAFADERPAMRAAASHAARVFVESGRASALAPEDRDAALARLRPGLEVVSMDEDPTVSIRALIALAYLGDEDVVARLERLYQGGNFRVKLEVTRALGWIHERAAHGFLTRVMAEERRDENSGALRAAALESMARSGHADAIRLLRYYLLNDRDTQVRDAAGRTLADLGGDEARFALVEHLTSGEPDAERRARVVDVLGRFEGEIVPGLLRRHLADPDARVRAAAALRAADHNLPDAFPFLVQLLRRGSGATRDEARTALENLTSTRFAETGYTLLAERYEQWIEDPRVKGRSDRVWFREALRREGYDTGPLAVYLEEKQGLGAVPLLSRVLRDEDPVLRRNASVALERLTGRRIGRVGRDTPAAEAARIADLWATWLEGLEAPGR